MIKVVVVDDQALVRAGFSMVLNHLVPESDLGFVIVSNASIGPGSLATQLVTRDIQSMYLGDADELS